MESWGVTGQGHLRGTSWPWVLLCLEGLPRGRDGRDSLMSSFPQMGRPEPPGEKVSDAQLSGVPAALHHALGDAIPGPEDSDLVPSVTLAAVLVLLFLLLLAWLVWDGLLRGSC